jgi:tetratricopeptide (TPR) repeat protein
MLAKAPVFPSGENLTHCPPYFAEAFRAADLDFIFMRLPGRGGPSGLPGEVAGFGLVRCLWNSGRKEEAMKQLNGLELPILWPEAAYAAAEMFWRQDQYEDALNAWKDSARLNLERGPWPPLEYPFDVALSMDEIYQMLDSEAQSLAGSTQPADIARRAAALLRLGRREEAVDALKAAPANASELVSLRKGLEVQ